MATTKQGRVRLAGRFPAGTDVTLVRVRDESVLRSQGGEAVGTATVKKDGTVEFSDGVDVGGRYFVTGYVDGEFREVRARGNAADGSATVLEQPPVGPDRVRLTDGAWADEVPERERPPKAVQVAPAPRQNQVPKGQVQRSDTARGYAHPSDPRETLPYPRQEDVKAGTVQMSDTERGMATPVADTPERQDQVPAGVVQRSATPLGVATPIPGVSAVDEMEARESSTGKAMRGQPVRVAAEPLDTRRGKRSARATPDSAPAGAAGELESDDPGRDAMGQPAYSDVASAAGVVAPGTRRQRARAVEPEVPEGESAGSKTRAVGTSVKGAKGEGSVKTDAQRKRIREDLKDDRQVG